MSRERNAVARLIDDGEVIGSVPALRSSQRSSVLRTQDGINPVFVRVSVP